jgi:isocitrate/isopropylmalate dehydrogenase
MSKPPISFRLNDYELNLLESNQRDGESLSQTAARLLREKLGVLNGPIENLETKTLDGLIEDKVNRLREDVNIYVDNRVNAILERIEKLEVKPKTSRRSPTKEG